MIAPELWDSLFNWLQLQYYVRGPQIANLGNFLGQAVGGSAGLPKVPVTGALGNVLTLYSCFKTGWDVGTLMEPAVSEGVYETGFYFLTGHLSPSSQPSPTDNPPQLPSPQSVLDCFATGGFSGVGACLVCVICPECCKESPPSTPGDPNAKTGPSGYGTNGFISPQGLFAYRIDFEN